MESLVLFLMFAVFSVVRTLAEKQAQKPQEKPTVPSSRKRPSRPFDQPLRRLEEVLKEVETALSPKEEPVQRAQPKLKIPEVEISGEGVSLEHPPLTSQRIVLPTEAPPLQSSVPVVEELPRAKLQKGFMSDKEEVLRGLVYAEILGPPKALQHFKRR